MNISIRIPFEILMGTLIFLEEHADDELGYLPFQNSADIFSKPLVLERGLIHEQY